jgi:hypothetical protein
MLGGGLVIAEVEVEVEVKEEVDMGGDASWTFRDAEIWW